MAKTLVKLKRSNLVDGLKMAIAALSKSEISDIEKSKLIQHLRYMLQLEEARQK